MKALCALAMGFVVSPCQSRVSAAEIRVPLSHQLFGGKWKKLVPIRCHISTRAHHVRD